MEENEPELPAGWRVTALRKPSFRVNRWACEIVRPGGPPIVSGYRYRSRQSARAHGIAHAQDDNPA
jgi:hypothetical protein